MFHRISVLLNRSLLLSRIMDYFGGVFGLGCIKHNVAVMSGVPHEAEITEGERSARRICVLIFCCYLYTCTSVHLYTFLNEPTLCSVVFVFFPCSGAL